MTLHADFFMTIILRTTARLAVLVSVCGLLTPAFAHISLRQPVADAGTAYRAVLRVAHGCGAFATTAIAVQLPAGFSDVRPEPRAGWTLLRRENQVRWTAESKDAELPSSATGEFIVNGKLPATPGPLWLNVHQVCEQGRVDWSQRPAHGTLTAGLNAPAVLLLVQAPSAVVVEEAWVRPSVSGQQGTGGYMKLTARDSLRLVGASSPVAGVAEVHEMKMDGEVMTMRAVRALDLPAGKTVVLAPGGLHLMLMDLSQPLLTGSSVPLTLVLQDSRGVERRVQTRLLVSPSAPVTAASTDAHKH